MRQLRLITLYLRLGILNEVQYRVNFFSQIIQSALGLFVALGALSVIFAHTTTLNGWSSAEILALVGVYFLIAGLINLIIQPSMNRLMEDIQNGLLDYVLTKPEDAQLMISVREIQMWKIIDVGMGIAVLVAALVQLHEQIGWLQGGAFILILTCGGLMIYCFWLMLASTSFWFVRNDDVLMVFNSLYQAGRWPVEVYPGWLQFTLRFIFPVAFAVTVPVQALTGRLTWPTFALTLGMTVVLLIVSRFVWGRGLRAYSGASA